MRLSVESVGDGFKSSRVTLRLKFTPRLEPERHLTLILDEMLFRSRGVREGEVLSAAMWWLTRQVQGGLRRIPLHVVTNASDTLFLAEATPLVVSLNVLSWQMTRLELPFMPHLRTLELRNCTCLRTVGLCPEWRRDAQAGGPQAHSVRELDLGETMVSSLHAITIAFPKLEILHVDGVHSITDWDEASRGLGSLRELNATATNLTNLSWLPRLADLRILKLHGCGEIADWSPIGQLHQLRDLNCNYGALTSIEWITGCRELEQLFLYGCSGLVDGAPIGRLSFLRRLNIGLHSFRTIGWLRHCTQLRSLWMQGATDAPVDGMDSIGELRELQVLNIAFAAVRDISWLPKCTALRELFMVGCSHVTNWRPIGDLLRAAKELQIVDLREANVSGVHKWALATAGLQELRLEETNLSVKDRLALCTCPPSVRVVL